MKKSAFKKITALFLILLVAFSASQVAFADEITEPVTEEVTEEFTEEVTEDVTEEVTDPVSEDVARIHVCSNMSIPLVIGHTYVYVENLSENPIKVGAYEVPVGEGVSVGCFAFTAYDGWGIYYNLEAYRENKNGEEGRIWSKSQTLTAEELGNMNDYLVGYLNHWDPIFNCSFFAYTVWNAATGDFLVPFPLPIVAHLMLMITGGKKGVLDMQYAEPDKVYRQRGTGGSARLENVCNATLNL